MTIMMPQAAVQSMPGATSRIISLPAPSTCTLPGCRYPCNAAMASGGVDGRCQHQHFLQDA